MRRKEIKVGDRIYFECYDGHIDSAVVKKIARDFYVRNGKKYEFNMLYTSPNTTIEDYFVLSPLDPKVQAYIRETKDKKKNIVHEALTYAYPEKRVFTKDEITLCKRLFDFFRDNPNKLSL